MCCMSGYGLACNMIPSGYVASVKKKSGQTNLSLIHQINLFQKCSVTSPTLPKKLVSGEYFVRNIKHLYKEKKNLCNDSFHMNETTELKEDTKVNSFDSGIKSQVAIFSLLLYKRLFCPLYS